LSRGGMRGLDGSNGVPVRLYRDTA
jgi:hypothetical protein